MAVRMAYFPHSGADRTSKITQPDLPARPTEVGPIIDTENSQIPLNCFDASLHEKVYLGSSSTGEAILPAQPADFDNRYLFPSLAQNERLRLTLLWYHTRLIEQDKTLLAKIDALVKGLQQAIGWDYAIAGILDESTYLRLATAHLPIARLPRREATCAHTINQIPSSVFMINDMSKDWRFRQSPHVEVGGLRSYAGTQLRLLADHGEEISLGSLCVASDTPQPPLAAGQQELLVRFAELISFAIATHTRQRRLKEREQMANFLSTLQDKVELDYEANAVEVVRQAYPRAQVSLQVPTNGKVVAQNRPPFALSEVYEGLWEDTEFIDETINTSNYDTLRSSQTVRAIVARCGSSDKYLVVASTDMHYVFDDFDAWYVAKAASIIADTLQGQLLKQALEARETFLRGMTHQLRTPIHGILGSVELLAEELAAKHILMNGHTDADGEISTSPLQCLATIKNSGQELMTTVNNILKHNTWTDALRQRDHEPYDLRYLEDDIIPEILTLLPAEQLRGVSIDFRCEVPEDYHTLITDAQMFKDCLQSVILNATQSVIGTSSGAVSVTIRCTSDLSWLVIDVVDNGIGLDLANHERIFEPYEKADSHKPGAGLGLTLASKMATILNGCVKLISSALGSGSHFRIEFREPSLHAATRPSPDPLLLESLPREFAEVSDCRTPNHFASHIIEYLKRRGFQRCDIASAGLIVSASNEKGLASKVYETNATAVILSYEPRDHANRLRDVPSLIPIEGPLHTQKLDRILAQADQLHEILSTAVTQRDLDALDTKQSNDTIVEKLRVPEDITIAQLSLADESDMNRVTRDAPFKALLVDDNIINLRVLQMFCRKRRIPYITAEDGNGAYQHYKTAAEANEPFTLVLMDLQMPHCDGIQATQAIRVYEKTQRLRKSHIFMVTGQDSAKDKSSSRSAGADEFLVKPVGPRELDKHIGKYFKSYIPTS